MRILGIESTCDETAAAIVEDGRLVLSNEVASQVELHAKYRGVVPEIASRAHLENILPVLKEAVADAGMALRDVDAVAVAHRPGLIGSLLIGVTAAKTLAWSLGKPLVGVDHVHAHLYSVMLEERTNGKNKDEGGRMKDESEESATGNWQLTSASSVEPTTDNSTSDSSFIPSAGPGRALHPLSLGFPAVGLVVSGGHTALYELRDWQQVRLIGSTIDDAAGEAYDKVAALLGLGYPGGPIIDKLAVGGDPAGLAFPRSLLGRDSLDFSFSGLKTAVLYHVYGVPGKDSKKLPESPPPMSQQQIADIAASFQAACIDVIVKKLKRAIRKTGAKSVLVGGGVSANRGLRAALTNFSLPVVFPRPVFCTDNAAMSAGLAHVLLQAGQTSPLDLDAITHSQFLD